MNRVIDKSIDFSGFFYLFIVIALSAPSTKVFSKTKDHKKLVHGIISIYFPNAQFFLIQKKVHRDFIQKKLKGAVFDGKNKIEYKGKNGGKIHLWLNEKGFLLSARFRFKVHKEISRSETTGWEIQQENPFFKS